MGLELEVYSVHSGVLFGDWLSVCGKKKQQRISCKFENFSLLLIFLWLFIN